MVPTGAVAEVPVAAATEEAVVATVAVPALEDTASAASADLVSDTTPTTADTVGQGSAGQEGVGSAGQGPTDTAGQGYVGTAGQRDVGTAGQGDGGTAGKGALGAETMPPYMAAMISSIHRVEGKLLQLSESMKKTTKQTKSADATVAAGIKGARSLDVILDCASVLTCSPETNVIWCETCLPQFSAGHDAGETQLNTVGLFRYDFDLGTNFPKPFHVPRAFSQLKDAIKSHIGGKRHHENTTAKTQDDERESRRNASATRIGKNVLRVAYQVMKQSLLHLMFEKLVVINHLNGAKMGDLCHSAMQMQKYRKAFSDEVLRCVADHITNSPCVALVADKVTVMHRTIDITAIITVVPEAPAHQLVQSYILAAPVVKDHDGASLAEGWKATANAAGIKTVEKLSAICTDGQYHHNAVPARFLKLLRDSESDYAKRSKVPCVPCLWDGAHLLELADGDARKEATSAWVSDTVSNISRVNRRFAYGKGREDFLEAGEASGVEVRGILQWSDTRFAPHAANVLQAFMSNIPASIAALKAQLESGRLTAALEKEVMEDIKLLEGETVAMLWINYENTWIIF